MQLPYPVRAVRNLQKPSKNTGAVLTQTRRGHSTVVVFLRDVASLAPFWTLRLVFPEDRWRLLPTPVLSSVACEIRSLLYPA